MMYIISHVQTRNVERCTRIDLDFNAEWRFYGADDNSSRDPTRCGMPVNPLLKQSSFGCKVLEQLQVKL